MLRSSALRPRDDPLSTRPVAMMLMLIQTTTLSLTSVHSFLLLLLLLDRLACHDVSFANLYKGSSMYVYQVCLFVYVLSTIMDN